MAIIPFNFTLNDVLLSGVSGSSAVIVQSCSIIWAENLVRKQRTTDRSLFSCASKIIRNNGLKSLFKGTFSLFCYNSFARFGDVTSNFIVLNTFKSHNSLNSVPLFIQSWFSWALATGYRVCITPLQVYGNHYNFRSQKQHNRKHIYLRAYFKQIKPQIMALYGWFLVQNYLIQNTQRVSYAEGFFNAWSKYVWIGFLSMISYDCYKKAKHLIFGKSLLSKFWFNRVCLRGINGSIFCSTSIFIRQKITQ